MQIIYKELDYQILYKYEDKKSNVAKEDAEINNLINQAGFTSEEINSIDELHYYFDIGKISDINLIKNRIKSHVPK